MKQYLYLVLAGLWAVSLVGVGWYVRGATAAHYEAQIAEANNKALEERDLLQGKINELTQKSIDDLNAVTLERDAALERLRDRPTRIVKTSRTDCKGTTGAELSRKDAEFLTREAARADRIRSSLKACYDYADSLQQ